MTMANDNEPMWPSNVIDRQTLLRVILERHRRQGLRDLRKWVTYVTPEYDEPAHLPPLCRVFDRIQRGEQVFACVEAPPRHGKTDTVFAGVSRFLYTWPHKLVAYCTYGADFANDQSRKLRAVAGRAGVQFGREQTLDHRAQGFEASATVRYWQTNRGGGVLAVGRSGSIMGRGPDLLLVDDPYKDRREAEQQTVRDETWSWFNGTLFPRREPNCSVIVFHQRWNNDDLIARLKKQCEAPGYSGPRWEFYSMPAISEAGRPLWPERYDVNELALIRAQVEEYNWFSQYQQAPIPRGGQVFPEWTTYSPDEDVIAGSVIAIAVDVAVTKKTTSDYSAGGVGALRVIRRKLEDGRILRRLHMDVLDARRWKAEAPELCQHILDLQDDWPSAAVLVETSGVGQPVAQTLRQIEPRLRLVEVRPTTDKFLRAQALVGGIRRGDARIPSSAPWVKDYVAEFAAFEANMGHKHDDQVDWTVHLWNWGQEMIDALGAGVEVAGESQLSGGGF